VVAGIVGAPAHVPLQNMNGEYHVQNSDSFNTNFSSYPALGRPDNTVRYVEAYSDEIETIYSQVWWTMGDVFPFPSEMVKEFDDKVMAIVGYEFDQMMQNSDGTESPVPVTWSYNHHYSGRVVGKYAEMIKVPVTGYDDPRAKNVGHLSNGPAVWEARSTQNDPRPNSPIPAIVDFDEANGGEWRRSFHGYPHGYAQLVDSPVGFRIEPMQIDTRNRDGSMATPTDGFHPDPALVPKAYAAPLTGPDAIYSGLLECPCTDRISKVIPGAYSLQSSGVCARTVVTSTECFKAADEVGLPTANRTFSQGADPEQPPGCSLTAHGPGLSGQSIFFNTLQSSRAKCGGDGSVRLAGAASSLVNLTVALDGSIPGGSATITITGPATVWFGVAFGATEMAQQPGAIIVDGEGEVAEYQLGDHVGGVKLATQVKVLSNRVEGDRRTVVLTRAFAGATSAHFSFNTTSDGVPISWMNAVGSTATYSFHKLMSTSTLVLARLEVPSCVCADKIVFGKTRAAMIYEHDDGTTEQTYSGGGCTNTTPTDLIPTRNPRCDGSTYVGGLSCCHHLWLLTDKEQRPRISNETLKFRMKVRIWYQEYIPATSTSPASHQLLFRMYHSIAGEYDVVKNPTGIQTNVFKFKARDMVRYGNVRTETFDTPYPTANQTGIKLFYANGHCHAASCIEFSLFNDDTGELICKQVGRMGTDRHPQDDDRFNEAGYVRLYPCMWGDKGEGLPEPMFLSFDTNLRSVKVTNATYTHYGEMAHWQTRGVLA